MLPGALTAVEQRRVVRDALTRFLEPPNRTNHSTHAGPLPGLWKASLKVLATPEMPPRCACEVFVNCELRSVGHAEALQQ